MRVLVFGNPLMREDNLALKLIPKLRKEFSNNKDLDFVEFDSTEDLHKQGRNLIILDVAEGVEEVEIIEDLDRLSTGKRYSMHDFDLSYNLKILKRIGILKSIRIIAIPQFMDEELAFEEVCRVLRNF